MSVSWNQLKNAIDKESMLQSADTRRNAKKSRERFEALEMEVGQLTLLCRALLAVLEESGAVVPEKLVAALKKIDLEDGVEDGAVTPASKRPGAKKAPLLDGKSMAQRRRRELDA